MSHLILALDYNDSHTALNLVNQLDPNSCALKVGSELFTLAGADFIHQLTSRQFKVFLDLKFHDIPNTVARSCKIAADLGVWMLNVHASGGMKMMVAAKEALENYSSPPLLIAVTVLTSMNQVDLAELGINNTLDTQVNRLAKLAKEAGLNGVVSSAQEADIIKKSCGNDFLVVTPGIRPRAHDDDQCRTLTPEQAINAGSDFLVIGRPITQSANPVLEVANINSSLAALLK